MSNYATSARPPWAITVWVDNRFVYSEVPAVSGPPLIQKYPLTENGLGQALNFLRAFHRDHQPKGGDYKITLQANIKHPKVSGTDAQRERARDILKRLKIT